ncbi:MFS transporter [Paenarthrobacter sp. NPDC089675]|uniref:MFS transporter n=1 Tax=Paenarthrobacter TaxID=1742992 RepID=UPI003808A20A
MSQTLSTIDEKSLIRKIAWRLMPFLVICYLINFLDRTNVGYAASAMETSIGLDVAAYGLGAGIFFIAYFIFEVPSNIALHRFGARVWIGRIMISWGVVAALMAVIHEPWHFFSLRFLLGAAEAGFFPGVVFYLTLWFPVRYRARLVAIFFLGIPIAQVVGAPISTSLIALGDSLGLEGWRLMYGVEALPAVLLGIACFFVLRKGPQSAPWLSEAERSWLTSEIAKDEQVAAANVSTLSHGQQIMAVLKRPIVWGLALIYFGLTSGSNVLNFFLPTVVKTLQSSLGLDPGIITTGIVVAIPYGIAALALVLWSRHSDRTLERRFHVAIPAVLGAITTIICLALGSPVASIIGFVVLVSAVYCSQSVVWSVPSELLTGVGSAVAFGVINSIGNLSGFSGPYLTGWVVQLTGSYTIAFTIVSSFVLAGGVLAFILIPGRAKRAAQQSVLSGPQNLS